VSTPEKDDFHIDLTASGPVKSYGRPAAVIASALLIGLIVLTMTTGVASRVLPMDEAYMSVLVPRAPDGQEALSLKDLNHEIQDLSITVRGRVGNRTDYPVNEILAIVEMQETTGRFPVTMEVPVEPWEIPPQGEATFQASANMQQQPAGYVVKFRIADGPFVPHKDDRASMFGTVPK
jgi:hypothetical protein